MAILLDHSVTASSRAPGSRSAPNLSLERPVERRLETTLGAGTRSLLSPRVPRGPHSGRSIPAAPSRRAPRLRRGPAGNGAHPLGVRGGRRHLAVEPARLTHRGNVVVALLAAAAVACAAWVAVSGLTAAESGARVEATQHVRITAGDTAWGLAQRLRPSVDPRVTIAQMQEINGMDAAAPLVAGSVVEIPVDTPTR